MGQALETGMEGLETWNRGIGNKVCHQNINKKKIEHEV